MKQTLLLKIKNALILGKNKETQYQVADLLTR